MSAPLKVDASSHTIVPGAERRKEKSSGAGEQGRFAFAYVDRSPTRYTLAESGLTLKLQDEGVGPVTYRKDLP